MKYVLEENDLIKMKVSYNLKFENGRVVNKKRYCDKLSILHFDKTGKQSRESVLLKNCSLEEAQNFVIDELAVFVSVPRFGSEMSIIVYCNSCGKCKYTLLDKDDELVAQNMNSEQAKQTIRKYAAEDDYMEEEISLGAQQ